MNNYTDEQLKSIIAKTGKEMTAESSSRAVGLEKKRIMFVKELMKRGLGGYPSKAKYRAN